MLNTVLRVNCEVGVNDVNGWM